MMMLVLVISLVSVVSLGETLRLRESTTCSGDLDDFADRQISLSSLAEVDLFSPRITPHLVSIIIIIIICDSSD